VRVFHGARLHCMPKGYFLGAGVGVLGTANFIGMAPDSLPVRHPDLNSPPSPTAILESHQKVMDSLWSCI
jgi:hypothetical protein